MNNKTLIFTGLLFCATSVLFAQKCKPKHSETNKFTEKTTEYWGNTFQVKSSSSPTLSEVPTTSHGKPRKMESATSVRLMIWYAVRTV